MNNKITFDELKSQYDDLSDNYSILQGKFEDLLKLNDKLFNELNCAVEQYNSVVKQNKSLQTELKNLKELPFFPYALNSGNRTDFGEFYLISHAWFSISNFPIQLGIVEVEWKSSGVRKMYLGAGSTNGKDFKQDVLSIALHGQKIKDSSEV